MTDSLRLKGPALKSRQIKLYFLENILSKNWNEENPFAYQFFTCPEWNYSIYPPPGASIFGQKRSHALFKAELSISENAISIAVRKNATLGCVIFLVTLSIMLQA